MGDDEFSFIQDVLLNMTAEGAEEGGAAVADPEVVDKVLYSEVDTSDAIVLVQRTSRDTKWGIRMKKDTSTGHFIILSVDENGPAGVTGASRLRPNSEVKTINGHDVDTLPKEKLFGILGDAYDLVIVVKPPPIEQPEAEEDVRYVEMAQASSGDKPSNYEDVVRQAEANLYADATNSDDNGDNIPELGDQMRPSQSFSHDVDDDSSDSSIPEIGDSIRPSSKSPQSRASWGDDAVSVNSKYFDPELIGSTTVSLSRDDIGERWGIKFKPFESIYKIVQVGPTGIAVPHAAELPPNSLVISVNDVRTAELDTNGMGEIMKNALTLSLIVRKPDADMNTVVLTRESVNAKWGLWLGATGDGYYVKKMSTDGAAASHANELPQGTRIIRMNGTLGSKIAKEDLKTLLTSSLSITLDVLPPSSDDDVPQSLPTRQPMPEYAVAKSTSDLQPSTPAAVDYDLVQPPTSAPPVVEYDVATPVSDVVEYDMARPTGALRVAPPLQKLYSDQDALPELPSPASPPPPDYEGEPWSSSPLPPPPDSRASSAPMIVAAQPQWADMEQLSDAPTRDLVMLYRDDVSEKWGLRMTICYSDDIPADVLEGSNEEKAPWKVGYEIRGLGSGPQGVNGAVLENSMNTEEAVRDGTREASAVDELPVGTRIIKIQNVMASAMDDVTLATFLREATELALLVERPHHIYAVDLEREDGEIWGLHFGKTETSYNIRMVDASGAAAREADRLPPGAEIVKIRSDDDEHFIKTDEFAAEDFQRILVNSNRLELKIRVKNDDKWRRTKLGLMGGRPDFVVRRRFHQIDTQGAEVAWIDATDNREAWVRNKWPFSLEANRDRKADFTGFVFTMTVAESHPDAKSLRSHTSRCTRSWGDLNRNCVDCGGNVQQPRRCRHLSNTDAAIQRSHLCEGCGPMMVVSGDIVSAVNGCTEWRDVMNEMNTKDVLQLKFKTHKRLAQVSLQPRLVGWTLDQKNQSAYREMTEKERLRAEKRQDSRGTNDSSYTGASHARSPSPAGPTAADISLITYNIYECKPTKESTDDFEEYVRLAQKHEEQEQFSDALTEYSRALEILENEGYEGEDGVEVTIPYYFVAFAYIGMGRCYMNGRRYQKAIDFFNDYIRIAETLLARFTTPEQFEAEFPEARDMLMMGYTHLGTALYHQRKFIEAREQHVRCRELAGEWIAYSQETQRRYPQFVSEPEDMRYQMICAANIGNTYGGEGDFQKARHYHTEQLRFARMLNDAEAESRANFNLENDCASAKQYGVATGHKNEKERLRELEDAELNDTFGDRQGRDMTMGWLSKHGGHASSGPSSLSNARLWCVLSTKPTTVKDTDNSGISVDNVVDVSMFELFETTQADIAPVVSLEISLMSVSNMELYNQPEGKCIPPHSRSFRIVTVKRNEKGRILSEKAYYFTADNANDAEAWVNSLNKAQTSNPRSWTMRKMRTIGTPYTPKKPEVEVVEVEVEENQWLNHMQNPTGYASSGQTQYNPLFDSSPVSFGSSTTNDHGFLEIHNDQAHPNELDFDEQAEMEEAAKVAENDAAFMLQLNDRSVNDSATDSVGLAHDGHAEFEAEHVAGVERLHEGDNLSLLAASTAGALSCGVTLSKKYQKSATIDSVAEASPFAACEELMTGVTVLAINGQETWDLDYDSLNAVLDEAEASGTMKLTVPKEDLVPHTEKTVLYRDTPDQTWGMFYHWSDDAVGFVVSAVTVNSPAAHAGLRSGDTLVKVDQCDVTTVGDLEDANLALNDATSVPVTVGRWKATDPLPAPPRELDTNSDKLITREEYVAARLRAAPRIIPPGCRIVRIQRGEGEKWGMHMRYEKAEEKYYIKGVAEDGAAACAAHELPAGTEVVAINEKQLKTLPKKELQVLLVASVDLELLVRDKEDELDVQSIHSEDIAVNAAVASSTPMVSQHELHSAVLASNPTDGNAQPKSEEELKKIENLDKDIERLGQLMDESAANLDEVARVQREAEMTRARQERELAALRQEEELERERRLKEIEQMELAIKEESERRKKLEEVAKLKQAALDEQRRKDSEIEVAKLQRRKSNAKLERQRQELEHQRMYLQLENEAEEERRRYEEEAERLQAERQEELARLEKERELESLRLEHEAKLQEQERLLEAARLKHEAESKAHELELKRLRNDAAKQLHNEKQELDRVRAAAAASASQEAPARPHHWNGWTRIAEMIAQRELTVEKSNDLALQNSSQRVKPYTVRLTKTSVEKWGITFKLRDEQLLITGLVEGGAAHRMTLPVAEGGSNARLKVHQRIEDINGIDSKTLGPQDLVAQMRGNEITLTVCDPRTLIPD